MPSNEERYEAKGYGNAEVEILVKLARIDERLKVVCDSYVKRDEFEPIQRLVYGLVGVILLAVIGAVVAMVIQ